MNHEKEEKYHSCGKPLEKKDQLDYCSKCEVYIFQEGLIKHESKNPKDITNLIEALEMKSLKRR